MQYKTVQCRPRQCYSLFYNTIQCSAVQYNAVQYGIELSGAVFYTECTGVWFIKALQWSHQLLKFSGHGQPGRLCFWCSEVNCFIFFSYQRIVTFKTSWPSIPSKKHNLAPLSAPLHCSMLNAILNIFNRSHSLEEYLLTLNGQKCKLGEYNAVQFCK